MILSLVLFRVNIKQNEKKKMVKKRYKHSFVEVEEQTVKNRKNNRLQLV